MLTRLFLRWMSSNNKIFLLRFIFFVPLSSPWESRNVRANQNREKIDFDFLIEMAGRSQFVPRCTVFTWNKGKWRRRWRNTNENHESSIIMYDEYYDTFEKRNIEKDPRATLSSETGSFGTRMIYHQHHHLLIDLNDRKKHDPPIFLFFQRILLQHFWTSWSHNNVFNNVESRSIERARIQSVLLHYEPIILEPTVLLYHHVLLEWTK